MKKILCFGDSNTYGYIPKTGLRYDSNTRWTGLLQKLAGSEFEIIEAGYNNRNCFALNPDGDELVGYKILPKYLSPDLDAVILALGINDLQVFYKPSEKEIKNGMQNLIDITKRNCPNAKILVVSPSRISDFVLKGFFAFQFDELSIEKSLHIGSIYKQITEENHCWFLDLDKIAKVSPKDGLHYEPDQHKIIAYAVFDILSEAFKKPSKETD